MFSHFWVQAKVRSTEVNPFLNLYSPCSIEQWQQFLFRLLISLTNFRTHNKSMAINQSPVCHFSPLQVITCVSVLTKYELVRYAYIIMSINNVTSQMNLLLNSDNNFNLDSIVS